MLLDDYLGQCLVDPLRCSATHISLSSAVEGSISSAVQQTLLTGREHGFFIYSLGIEKEVCLCSGQITVGSAKSVRPVNSSPDKPVFGLFHTHPGTLTHRVFSAGDINAAFWCWDKFEHKSFINIVWSQADMLLYAFVLRHQSIPISTTPSSFDAVINISKRAATAADKEIMDGHTRFTQQSGGKITCRHLGDYYSEITDAIALQRTLCTQHLFRLNKELARHYRYDFYTGSLIADGCGYKPLTPLFLIVPPAYS